MVDDRSITPNSVPEWLAFQKYRRALPGNATALTAQETLPQGIWDDPQDDEFGAYYEFLQAWNASDEELYDFYTKETEGGAPTVRALSYSCYYDCNDQRQCNPPAPESAFDVTYTSPAISCYDRIGDWTYYATGDDPCGSLPRNIDMAAFWWCQWNQLYHGWSCGVTAGAPWVVTAEKSVDLPPSENLPSVVTQGESDVLRSQFVMQLGVISVWLRYHVELPSDAKIVSAFMRLHVSPADVAINVFWLYTKIAGSLGGQFGDLVPWPGIDPPAEDETAPIICDPNRTDNRVSWRIYHPISDDPVLVETNDIACVVQELYDKQTSDGESAFDGKMAFWIDPCKVGYDPEALSALYMTDYGNLITFYEGELVIVYHREINIEPESSAGVKIGGKSTEIRSTCWDVSLGTGADYGVTWHEVPINQYGSIVIGWSFDVDIPSIHMQAGAIACGEADCEQTHIFGGVFDEGELVVECVYNIETSGGLVAAGDSPSDHSWHMQGGLLAAGEVDFFWSQAADCRVQISGQVGITGVTNEPPNGVLRGGAKVGRRRTTTVNTMSFLTYLPDGSQITVGGDDDPAHYGIGRVTPSTDGGVEVSDELDPTIAHYRFNHDLVFLWKLRTQFVLDLTFLWSTGQLGIFWYRILGKARQGDTCDLIADPCCQKFIMNIHARTVAELCEKLSKRKFTLPIESIQRFKRPAALANMFDDWANQQDLVDAFGENGNNCDELEEVGYCHIPQCADFCVDQDILVPFEFDFAFVHVDSEFYYVTGNDVPTAGKVDIGGASICSLYRSVTRLTCDGSGTIGVEGDSTCTPSAFDGRGGVTGGGEAYTECTSWHYIGGVWPTQTVVNQAFVPPGTGYTIPFLYDGTDVVDGRQPWLLPERVNDDNDPPPQPGQSTYYPTWCDVSYRKTSQFLVAKPYNLQIPEDVNILGIKVRVSKISQQVGVHETHVVLVLGDQIISNNLASSSDWPLIITLSTYGSNGADGLPSFIKSERPLTPADLNSPDFGVAVRVIDAPGEGASDYGAYAGVDYIRVRVYYEELVGQKILVDGTGDVRSSAYSYVGSGGAVLSSNNQMRSTLRFVGTGRGQGFSYGLTTGGSCAYDLTYVADGTLTAAGSASFKANPAGEEMLGGATTTGSAEVKPFFDESAGGIKLSGSHGSRYRYRPNGLAIYTGGAASTLDVKLKQEAEGGIETGGDAIGKCSYHSCVATGSVDTSGTSYTLPGSVEPPIIEAEFYVDVSETSVVFGSDVDNQDLTALTDTQSKCGCYNIPLSVHLTHNLNSNNIFAQFLARNNFTMARTITLRYNTINDSWQANLHYQGLSADANTSERWDLVFDIQCTSVMGGVDLGNTILKLAVEVFRKNLTTLEDFDTRIVVGILPDAICEANVRELDFSVSLDTVLEIATVRPSAVVYQTTLFDNIGLFKNRYWLDNPEVTFSVTQSGIGRQVQRVDLTDVVYV